LSGRRLALAGRVVAGLLRLLGASWRVRSEGIAPSATRSLGATWHGGLVPVAHRFRDCGIAVAISRSRDGDLAAAVLEGLGYPDPPRGSSSHGGVVALRALLNRQTAGDTVGIVTDGPRGPARVSKPGIIGLARLGRAPIVPIGVAARPALRIGSWDRLMLPLPFAAVAFHFGAPVVVPRDSDPEAVEQARQALDRALAESTKRASDSLARRRMA
jgi:lysophospholipid acyltransferase (LPLAT)-like uncharacterized protein